MGHHQPPLTLPSHDIPTDNIYQVLEDAGKHLTEEERSSIQEMIQQWTKPTMPPTMVKGLVDMLEAAEETALLQSPKATHDYLIDHQDMDTPYKDIDSAKIGNITPNRQAMSPDHNIMDFLNPSTPLDGTPALMSFTTVNKLSTGSVAKSSWANRLNKDKGSESVIRAEQSERNISLPPPYAHTHLTTPTASISHNHKSQQSIRVPSPLEPYRGSVFASSRKVTKREERNLPIQSADDMFSDYNGFSENASPANQSPYTNRSDILLDTEREKAKEAQERVEMLESELSIVQKEAAILTERIAQADSVEHKNISLEYEVKELRRDLQDQIEQAINSEDAFAESKKIADAELSHLREIIKEQEHDKTLLQEASNQIVKLQALLDEAENKLDYSQIQVEEIRNESAMKIRSLEAELDSSERLIIELRKPSEAKARNLESELMSIGTIPNEILPMIHRMNVSIQTSPDGLGIATQDPRLADLLHDYETLQANYSDIQDAHRQVKNNQRELMEEVETLRLLSKKRAESPVPLQLSAPKVEAASALPPARPRVTSSDDFFESAMRQNSVEQLGMVEDNGKRKNAVQPLTMVDEMEKLLFDNTTFKDVKPLLPSIDDLQVLDADKEAKILEPVASTGWSSKSMLKAAAVGAFVGSFSTVHFLRWLVIHTEFGATTS